MYIMHCSERKDRSESYEQCESVCVREKKKPRENTIEIEIWREGVRIRQ